MRTIKYQLGISLKKKKKKCQLGPKNDWTPNSQNLVAAHPTPRF